MPDDSPTDARAPKLAPHGNTNNSRIVVAFPFSAVKINDPNESVTELAKLLVELVDLVATSAPSPAAADLATRARALAQRIEG